MRTTLAIALSCAMLIYTSSVQAERRGAPASNPSNVPITKCDDLAANSKDPQAVAPGTSWNEFKNAGEAIAPCREAVQRYPNTVRFKYQLARALHKSGSNVEAFKWYRGAAEQNYASAQYTTAYSYWLGVGVVKDMAEAARWLRKAASQGHPGAQYRLADAYAYGKFGMPIDQGEAVRWYLGAAELSHSLAQYILGTAYEYGKLGVAIDKAEAVRWYRRAAEQGHEIAKSNLRLLER